MRKLVLASTSRYRRELLARLGLEFSVCAPDVDETRGAGESADELVRRLARSKAWRGSTSYPEALLIGSDQVAVLDGEVLGKPGVETAAIRQLEQASGRAVTFLTGLCVLDAASGVDRVEVVPYTVRFRHLSGDEIRRYVVREQPLDCAGAIKSEGLGVALMEGMSGEDPTALVGLPLIRLCSMLREAGLDPLGP